MRRSPAELPTLRRPGRDDEPDCPSGTDRVAEAVAGYSAAEVIVNLQGDEPEADAAAIDRLFELLEATPTAAMATLATPIRDRHKLEDPSCVKVTFDGAGTHPLLLPQPDSSRPRVGRSVARRGAATFHQHIGIYGYRRSLLMQMPQWPVGQFERIEDWNSFAFSKMARRFSWR